MLRFTALKKSQTKQYIITASGRKVLNDDKIYMNRIISLSQDLLQCGISYGDTVTIASNNLLLSGRWIVEDCMDQSQHMKCDFLVSRSDVARFPQGNYRVKIVELFKHKN